MLKELHHFFQLDISACMAHLFVNLEISQTEVTTITCTFSWVPCWITDTVILPICLNRNLGIVSLSLSTPPIQLLNQKFVKSMTLPALFLHFLSAFTASVLAPSSSILHTQNVHFFNVLPVSSFSSFRATLHASTCRSHTPAMHHGPEGPGFGSPAGPYSIPSHIPHMFPIILLKEPVYSFNKYLLIHKQQAPPSSRGTRCCSRGTRKVSPNSSLFCAPTPLHLWYRGSGTQVLVPSSWPPSTME